MFLNRALNKLKRYRRIVAAIVAGTLIGLLMPDNSPISVSRRSHLLPPNLDDTYVRESDEGFILDNNDTDARNCSPQQHIMFLKTHKCASSSVQNLFLRYGIKHNLSFALPGKGTYFGHPEPFSASWVEDNLFPASGIADIFAVHSRLNGPENKKVVAPDASFITVVRDPPQLFESLYNYFHLDEFFGATLDEYLKFPSDIQLSLPRLNKRFGPNMMLFDMGVDIRANTTAVEIRRAIDEADKLFDIVMISERIDESLILLKELLCWDYSDVVFFTKNARRDDMKPHMSEAATEKLRELNSGDVLLYDHFLSKHERIVNKYGIAKMANEISLLNGARQKMFDDCGVRVVNKSEAAGTLFKEYSDQVNGYAVDTNASPNCLLLSLPELAVLTRLKADAAKLLGKDKDKKPKK
uniref:Galactosylceramide sulfotransferase-like n=2 Tax=Hirondellea gigas TaxID=1518452 RepID=A0A6A7FUN6_9CRUS